MLVAGGRLAAGSAAYAFFDAGLGDTVAADSLTVERLVDANHSVAARAGRSDDPGDTGLVQKVDEPQDGAARGEMGLAGQQARVLLQGPDHSMAIVGTVGRRPAQSLGDHVAIGARGDRVDHRVNDRGRVTVIVVGTHRTAGQALAAPERDAPGVAAGGALAGLLDADRAVPVLALPLQASQPLSAISADRWRDRRGAGLAKGDEEIADGPWRRGPAIGQDGGPRRQELGQVPRLRTTARDRGDHGPDGLEAEVALGILDQVRDQADRVRDGALDRAGGGHDRSTPLQPPRLLLSTPAPQHRVEHCVLGTQLDHPGDVLQMSRPGQGHLALMHHSRPSLLGGGSCIKRDLLGNMPGQAARS
ncbi:hypothetical protein ACE1N8_02890 [Streptomyces sp. DSM 116494]|uniref:hypothetical protein n=1 Tax=Streptomyces okerensis TaxID=3344655 RepID=UPI00388FC141